MKELEIILYADTDLTRELGLMKRNPLKENQCAFFDFKIAGCYKFWNKNVDFPISLVFCDSNGIVQDIKHLEARQVNSVRPDSADVRYVIEAHPDLPKKINLKKGCKIKFSNDNVFFEVKR